MGIFLDFWDVWQVVRNDAIIRCESGIYGGWLGVVTGAKGILSVTSLCSRVFPGMWWYPLMLNSCCGGVLYLRLC